MTHVQFASTILACFLAATTIGNPVYAGLISDRVSVVYSGNSFRLSNGEAVKLVYVDSKNQTFNVVCKEPDATVMAKQLLLKGRVHTKNLGFDEDGNSLAVIMVNNIDFVRELHQAGACKIAPGPIQVIPKQDIAIYLKSGRLDKAINKFKPTPSGDLPEAYWQHAYNDLVADGATEVRIPGGRVDILNDTYAIEVDRAGKWHEAIGQALHYADATGRKPAIALFDDGSPGAADHIARAKKIATQQGIKMDVINEHVPQGYQPMSNLRQTSVPSSWTGGGSGGNNYKLYKGERGGVYYINDRGNKTYVDRSLYRD
jgi:hypothetical protein